MSNLRNIDPVRLAALDEITLAHGERDIMTEITVRHTAWVTTAASMAGAGAGLDITQHSKDTEGYYEEHGEVQTVTTAWEEFDEESADELLTELGWERTSDWGYASGQWAAYVEPIA